MYKHVDNISTKRELDLEIQLDYKSPRFRNKALSYGSINEAILRSDSLKTGVSRVKITVDEFTSVILETRDLARDYQLKGRLKKR